MDVTIEPIRYEDKPVLRRLVQLYLYDFSEFEPLELNEHGEFDYRYLDHYWAPDEGEERHAFFIRVDSKRAGFALVRVVNGVNVFAEFFVMRRFRGAGVGAAAARAVLTRLPGDWLVHQVPANLPAQAFWRRVIASFTGGNYREQVDESGVTQRFTVP
ncbi:MAG: GNAT family N-acetyltransferase [Chloroflexi bacterium]|nr:GNAT family N-acetyltransferase [Chloroflexota bacterium]MCZ7578713.1 GNAT family N-acetyltransferase [Dehalococcoidia bacterium]